VSFVSFVRNVGFGGIVRFVCGGVGAGGSRCESGVGVCFSRTCTAPVCACTHGSAYTLYHMYQYRSYI
jgi:hypothetical protein